MADNNDSILGPVSQLVVRILCPCQTCIARRCGLLLGYVERFGNRIWGGFVKGVKSCGNCIAVCGGLPIQCAKCCGKHLTAAFLPVETQAEVLILKDSLLIVV
jgi:hypothetical protein